MADEEKNTRDLYAVLELASDATDEEIRRAFRTLAVKYHPDRSPGDAKAALRFKQINAAYQVLADPDKRQQYDELTAPIEDMALARRPVVVTPAPGTPETDPQETPEPETREHRVRRRRSSRRRRSGGPWTVLLAAPVLLVAFAAFRALSAGGLAPESAATEGDAAPTAAARAAANDPSPSRPGAITSPEVTPLPISDAPRRVLTETSPPPLAEQGRVRNLSGDRWAFDLPADWQDAPDAKGPRWMAPAEVGGSRASVRLVVTSFTGESASYFDALDRRPASGVVIDGESWESATKPDGLKREGRMVSGSATVARFVEYLVASRGRGFELTCSAAPDGFDAVRTTCERILGSLQIR